MLYEVFIVTYIRKWKAHSPGLIWVLPVELLTLWLGPGESALPRQPQLGPKPPSVTHWCWPYTHALLDNPAVLPWGSVRDSRSFLGKALAKPHLSYICDLVSQMGLGSSTPGRACMPLLDPGS